MIKTITSIPTSYNGQVNITLNDRDLDIVARNVIMLILLLAVDDVDTAIDCSMHIWYSAQISESHFDLLRTTVRPLIEAVCSKIATKSDQNPLAKKWSWGNRDIRIALTKKAWNAALAYLDLPPELSSQQAHNLRTAVTLAPERKDHLERCLFNFKPSQRVCFLKFRQDGILLPFSCSRSAYNIPNPSVIVPKKFNAR